MRSSQLKPGQKEVRLTGDSFIVDSSVELDLVKVEFPSGDALVLASGATGHIGRVEIDTRTEDGIKVQNADAQAAHNLTIDGGYVTAHGMSEGAHQDGIQVMGGRNLTFRKIRFQNFSTQGIFVNRAGSGATTPTDITFDGCVVAGSDPAVTDGPATPININASVRTTLKNSHACISSRFKRGIVIGNAAIDAITQNNREYPIGQCATFVDPGPDPEPDSLPLHVVSETDITITLGWTPVPGIGYRFSRSAGAGKFSHTWDSTRSSVRFSKDSNWYKVEALAAGPYGEHS